jgi:hypothetical protein
MSFGAFVLYNISSDFIFKKLRDRAFRKEFDRLDRLSDARVTEEHVNDMANKYADDYIADIRLKTMAVVGVITYIENFTLINQFAESLGTSGGGRRKKQRGGGAPERNIIFIDFTNPDGTHKSVIFFADPKDERFIEMNKSVYSILTDNDEIYNQISENLAFKELNNEQLKAAITSSLSATNATNTVEALNILATRGMGERFPTTMPTTMLMGQRMGYGGKRSKRRKRSSKRRSKRTKRTKRTKRRRTKRT